MKELIPVGLAAVSLLCSSWAAEAPKPYGPLPTSHQVDWQRMEYYGFVHLGLNTWTGREWGYGDENPELFNPDDFDADRIVRLFKEAGMKGMILTAKHHDGFCLWPTSSTGHNITKSPWMKGKGDLVYDFAKACHKAGIKFGVYISPWDRNHAEYAKPGYLKAYYKQISELLNRKKYGDIFEIWFDGANGGDGYYGGAKEGRKIPGGYYNFPEVVKMIRRLQSQCIIWGAGSVGDARWGGSERGHVNYPCWPTLDEKMGEHGFGTGAREGDRWVPAEGDTSIRSGWFWHPSANNTVKTPEHLLQIWFECVGRGANFILNVPPDQTGNIYPTDAQSLLEFKKLRDRLYAKDYALGGKAVSADVRGKDKKFAPGNLTDGNIETYWTTDDKVTTPSVEIVLPEKATFDVLRLREQIRLGQRVEGFTFEVFEDGEWKEVMTGSAIGNQVLLKLPRFVTTDKVRLNITKSAACPTISELSLFRMPVILSAPKLERSQEGMVSLSTPGGGRIHYTLDGTEPTAQSPVYDGTPLDLTRGGSVKACVIDSTGAGEPGNVASADYGASKKDWKVLAQPGETNADHAIDDNPRSFWHTHPVSGEIAPPQSFTVDMGSPVKLTGFTYLPRQDGVTHGMTDKYVFEVSMDNKDWQKAAEGEFSNLRANPIEHSVKFGKTEEARYFRFTGTHALDKQHVSAAEIGIIIAK